MRVRYRLFDVASAVVLLGVFANDPALQNTASEALSQLSGRGYTVASIDRPVSVSPIGGSPSSRPAPSQHAGSWQPGKIFLRPQPLGAALVSHYLRHELMHEVNYRTCGASLPLWANEASALAFSGEISGSTDTQLSEAALSSLRKSVRLGVPLAPSQMETLSKLVAQHGWPDTPCGVSEAIDAVLRGGKANTKTGFSYVLINLNSGRVLDTAGETRSAIPIGSLLKFPYVASLSSKGVTGSADELLRSDTQALKKRRVDFNEEQYRELILGVTAAPPENLSAVTLLGERDQFGTFPMNFSLPQAALLIRSTLLLDATRFEGLVKQGIAPQSTLARAPPTFIATLQRLHAGAKTGSVSDTSGVPEVGHLAVFWPAHAPTLLALFRAPNMRGVDVAVQATPLLSKWEEEFPSDEQRVKVSILSPVPKAAWTIAPDGSQGPCLAMVSKEGVRFSTCGRWKIETEVKKARRERIVFGLVEEGGETLVTDPESYADGVVYAEGKDLPRSAKEALRSVVYWNGVHGVDRHLPKHTLCDTSHCMVFLGEGDESLNRRQPRTLRHLLTVLDRIDALRGRSERGWFLFSSGGDSPWEQSVSSESIASRVNEGAVLDVRRERTRNGAVGVRLYYPEHDEAISCDRAMTLFDLKGCPDSIVPVSGGYVFSGRGEGHGVGLSLARAASLARSGVSAEGILREAYGGK
jgi:hypothetical protein